ncbi:hypothetical protein [Campylobacter sp. MG1]|uniref:hypothetical protein n=1 Tax=Campylobacter sp. MG1 TaxID=2976332 RepID=UPI00226CAA03|nr:hypothetical protein [Campylobacter sp. MG1]
MTEEMQQIKNEIRQDFVEIFKIDKHSNIDIDITIYPNRDCDICLTNLTSKISRIQIWTPKNIRHFDKIKSVMFDGIYFDLSLDSVYIFSKLFNILDNDKQNNIDYTFIDCKFRYCYFDFNHIAFNSFIMFHGCEFLEEVIFSNSTIYVLGFHECIIRKSITFKQIKFLNILTFNNVKDIDIYFNGVVFEKKVNFFNFGIKDFNEVRFNFVEFNYFEFYSQRNKIGDLPLICKCKFYMKNIVFKENVLFSDIKFEGGLFLYYLEFKKNVNITNSFKDNNFNGILKLEGFTLHQPYNFNFINNLSNTQIFVYDTKFKSHLVFPNLQKMSKNVSFINTIFEEDVKFENSTFNDIFILKNCVFNKDLSFKQTKFIKSFDFIENKVKDNIDFSCVSFEISPNFQSSIFEKLVILYKTKFKEIPNLYSASFSSSAVLDMPLVDIKNYPFNHLKDEIKNKNDLIDIKGVRECLNIFKNALLKTNNILEASKYKVLEFYAKELELDYKLEDKEEKIIIKEQFDRWFLKLNRTTSDHHTDFLKILLFTLSVIGGYFIANLYNELFVYDDKFFYILPSFVFLAFLSGIFIVSKKAKKIACSWYLMSVVGLCGIFYSPNIITPFLGAFSEYARNHYLYKAIDELDSQKALDLSKQILAKEPTSELNAKKILKDYKDELKSSDLLDKAPELKRAVAIDGGVSRLNIAYYLVLAFCIFALQKTMRKNSIIPS